MTTVIFVSVQIRSSLIGDRKRAKGKNKKALKRLVIQFTRFCVEILTHRFIQVREVVIYRHEVAAWRATYLRKIWNPVADFLVVASLYAGRLRWSGPGAHFFGSSLFVAPQARGLIRICSWASESTDSYVKQGSRSNWDTPLRQRGDAIPT